MASYLLYGSLVVVLVLFVVQTIRLQKARHALPRRLRGIEDLDRMALLGRLLAGVAHEMKTPLGAVCCSVGTRNRVLVKLSEELVELEPVLEGSGDTVAEDSTAPSSTDLADRLARMNKLLATAQSAEPVLDEALTRLQLMIEHLRLAARTGRPKPDGAADPDPLQRVDVKSVLDSSLLLVRHELKSGIDLELDLQPVPPISAHAGALGQVLVNLLINAVQSQDGKGRITVRTEQVGRRVHITVADDGPGLPTGVGERIFAADFTTKVAEQGTGLGLHISRQIVESLDGRITASDGADGGAVFVVDLPVAEADED